MAIIDSQVYVYEADTPKRPWHSVPNWPTHVTGDLPGHPGPARARVRRLGFQALPAGHRLDPRLRGRQLRAGLRALLPDRAPERQ